MFTLATTEKWTDGEGRPVEATEWHRIVVYGPAVAAVERMLRKGDRVMVEGRIATRAFQDREGNDRAVTEIVVSGWHGMVNILGGRRASPDRGPGQAEETPEAGNAGGSAPGPGSVSGAGAAE